MQRQEVCSAVSIASPHKPLLVVKCIFKRLEDTAWLSLIKWLWGCMTSRQCSSETQLIKTHGRVALLGLVFHKRALWHSKEVWSILPGPHASCLSQLSNTSLPLLQTEISHIPCCVSFSWTLHYVERHTEFYYTSEPLTDSGNPSFRGSSQAWDAQRLQEWVSLSWSQDRSHLSLLCTDQILI